MARIRSIHPGIWTDERFACLSMAGRLLFMGIWTEAWDDGVFEWKPLTLKMRIFPADNVDVGAELAALEAAGCVMKFQANGRDYGAVRNFQKFQRPKSPNSSGVLTNEVARFVGAPAGKGEQFPRSEEPLPNHSGTSSEIRSQMEDGGWRMEKEEGLAAAAFAGANEREPETEAPPETEDMILERKCREAAGYEQNPAPNLFVIQPIRSLIAEGFDLEREILPAIRAKSASLPRQAQSWSYFVQPVREFRDKSQRSIPPPRSFGERAETMRQAEALRAKMGIAK